MNIFSCWSIYLSILRWGGGERGHPWLEQVPPEEERVLTHKHKVDGLNTTGPLNLLNLLIRAQCWERNRPKVGERKEGREEPRIR